MKKILAALILFILLLSPKNTLAQEVDSQSTTPAAENSATASAEENTDITSEPNQTEQNEERIAELKTLYSQQIESYRQAEREFRIAKEQYESLQTLKLLEDAVQATRQVMIERNNVLLTYMDMLYLTLQNATGVNLPYKEAALESLESQVEALRNHQAAIQETTDRDGVAERATEFSALRPEVESASYRALSLISIGKLQTVHDKARLILGDLKEAQAEASTSALRKAQLDRAFAETERNLVSINSQLRTANDDYSRQEDEFRKSFYENIRDKLSPVYVELSQLVSYLQELLTI